MQTKPLQIISDLKNSQSKRIISNLQNLPKLNRVQNFGKTKF